mgnify:CR=1 FL=1
MRRQRQSKRAGFEAAARLAARQGPGIAMPQGGALVLNAGDLLGHLLLGLEVAWRAIMMRWAWGEPAPCMDSVR